ncbi:MAG: hypothetical protein QOF36_1435 [Microbacteriaceae bacterium]|jgi:uncharacterized protein (TIGR00369 family)|nr:hypothetical protein [Microbacteriaceae bacterium]
MTSDVAGESVPHHGAHANRSRTVTWEDPLAGFALMSSMTGLEHVRGMIEGTVPPPPMANILNMRIIDADVGSATFVCDPDESHYNPIGTVHGGLVCTMLDSAVGCATETTLPRGQRYTSVEIKVNYLRPVRSDSGQLTCVGTVTKSGSRVAFTEGVVTDRDGRLMATASSTLLIFPRDGASEGP